jgi:hypothetical protein
MKRLLLVVMVLLLAVGLMTAGETKQGSMSVNFLINGLGTFGVSGTTAGTANGGYLYGFGGSYYIQDDMALRLGLAFNTGTSSEKDVEQTGDEENITDMAFGIQPALLWYFMNEGPVSGYWGPMVMFGMSSHENEYVPPAGAAQTTKTSYSDFGAGIVMGAQWMAWEQVAFNAEYVLAYGSSSSTQDVGGTSTDGPTISGFGIYSWSVGVSLFLR